MPLCPPLTRQSRIALAAPASSARMPEDAHAGIAALRERGLTVEPGRALAGPHGYLSGPDDDRVGELNALLARDDLDAIVCLRGGYGLLRILDRVDYEAARRHPKLVVGYSDVTALQLALWRHAGVPSLSGAMAAPDWPTLGPEAEAQFWTLAGGASPFEIVGPGGEALSPVREGVAEGTLLGGNLALTAALLGTPHLPDLTGAILFVEDIGEPPYRIDGLFARLRLSGVLERLGGLVVGAFTGSDLPPDRPTFTVDEVVDHYARFVNGPVARGLAYGHFVQKSPLPIGVQARLVVERGQAPLTTTSPLTQPLA